MSVISVSQSQVPIGSWLTAPYDPLPAVRLWWLGQAGFAIEYGTLRMLIDPYLGDTLATKYAGTLFAHTRMHAAPVDAGTLRDVTVMLHTHAHTDHLDPETVAGVERHSAPQYIVPAARGGVAVERGVPAERMHGLTAGETLRIAPDVTVTAVPAAHEALDVDDLGRNLYLGYVIRLGDTTIYHSGDCVPYPGQAELLTAFGIDVALLPINGRDDYRLQNGVPGNFTLSEALELVEAANIPALVCHHFGLFDFNTVDRDAATTELEHADRDFQTVLPTLATSYDIAAAETSTTRGGASHARTHTA